VSHLSDYKVSLPLSRKKRAGKTRIRNLGFRGMNRIHVAAHAEIKAGKGDLLTEELEETAIAGEHEP